MDEILIGQVNLRIDDIKSRQDSADQIVETMRKENIEFNTKIRDSIGDQSAVFREIKTSVEDNTRAAFDRLDRKGKDELNAALALRDEKIEGLEARLDKLGVVTAMVEHPRLTLPIFALVYLSTVKEVRDILLKMVGLA